MNKRQTERIATIALAAFLVGMFLYQVAYGMNETVTSGNITATITAPNGSTINNVTITPLPQMVDLTGTWHFGAVGTITFTHHYHKFKYDWGGPVDIDKATFTSTVGDRTFKGYWDFDQPPPPYTAYLKLCGHYYLPPNTIGPTLSDCTDMNATIINDNHIELQNPAGDTIQLMR